MAVRLLDSVTATGASNSWRISKGVSEHTVQSTWSGSPTSVQITLEGSLDNSTWYQLASHNVSSADLTIQETMFHVTSKTVTYVRMNLETLTGGTSPALTCLYYAKEY